MEEKSKNIPLKAILIVIGAGIWVLVLQNSGIIPTSQNVRVINTVDVDGTVGINGTVDVSGDVSVGNTVDVNIDEILGGPAGCRTSYVINGKEFRSLDVSVR